MAIIRSKQKSRGFYMLERAVSDDQSISWAAKGMLVFLLAKPDDWTVNVEALVNFTAKSARHVRRDGVYAILTELVDAGYVERVKHSTGQLDYIVFDEPKSGNSQTGKIPVTEKPDPEKPDPENPTLVNTKEVVKTKVVGKTKGFDAGAMELPAWLPAELWSQWVEARKAIRKPMTEPSAKKCIKTLEACHTAGGDIVAVVEASIAGGWTGLFFRPSTTKAVANASRFDLQSMQFDQTKPGELPF